MSRLIAFVCLSALAACSTDPDFIIDPIVYDARVTIDATPDATLAAQCVDLRARWNALVVPMGRSCDAPSDCARVGIRQEFSCNAFPQLPGFGTGELPGDCRGGAVNGAALAPKSAEVTALETQFAQLCGRATSLCGKPGMACIADCAPGAELTCIDHTCGIRNTNSCFPPPPDAGAP